jgi:hypothetical protein
MVGYFERRSSRASLWSRRLAVFAATLFAVSGASHRFGLLETPAFIAVLGLVAVLAGMALLIAVLGLSRVWRAGDAGLGDALAGLSLALLVLAPYAMIAIAGFRYPQLHDISTDLADPPRFVAAFAERGWGTNTLDGIAASDAERQRAAYPDIVGRRYDAPAARVAAAVDALVGKAGWRVIRRDATGNGETIVEAVALTPLLGYPIDVAIRVTEEGETSFVDMRSASRFGEHDFGDNSRRIANFLSALDAAMADQAGE